MRPAKVRILLVVFVWMVWMGTVDNVCRCLIVSTDTGVKVVFFAMWQVYHSGEFCLDLIPSAQRILCLIKKLRLTLTLT